MFWLVAISIVALVSVPVIIALVESAGLKSGPWDVGFWGLARAVGGTCHVPWRRRGACV